MTRYAVIVAALLAGCGGRLVGEDPASFAADSSPDDAREDSSEPGDGGWADASPSDGFADTPKADASAPDTPPAQCLSLPNGVPLRTGAAPSFKLAAPTRVDLGTHRASIVAAGDVTGDGRADVVGADWNELAVFVQRNGQLRAPVTTAYPFANPSAMTLADLDRDGVFEIVVAQRSGLRILRSDANGSLTTVRDVAGPALARLHADDIDGDGFVDITGIATGPDGFSGNIVTYRGSESGELAPGDPTPLTGSVADLSIVDFDGDGVKDVVFTTANLAPRLVIMRRAGSSWVTTESIALDAVERPACAVGDLDADGRNDVALGDSKYQRGLVLVLHRNADGTFAAPRRVAENYYGSGPIQIVDVDADGVKDLVVLHPTAFEVGVLLARGATLATEVKTKFPTAGSVSYDFAVADVTCDGCPDVIGTDVGGLVLFRGTGCASR